MMEKKYQLVAWTENISDKENARVTMIPSVEQEIEIPIIKDLGECRYETYTNGSMKVTRKMLRAYGRVIRFKFLTGHYGDGIRYLIFAAHFCSQYKWLRHEFSCFCQEAIRMARKYRREDVLQESKPKKVLDLYLELTADSNL